MSIATTPAADEAVATLLSDVCGQPASAYTDCKTRRTRVSVYLPSSSAWSAQERRRLAAGLQALRTAGAVVGSARVSVETIRREDWAESWKRHFKPIAIAQALLVKPSWSRRRPRRGQAVVILDPGLSFGTGHHPTTRFCLEELVASRRPGARQSFLDIGTGSGILAIAAASLGFTGVTAFDNDPDAVRVARANAQVNGLAGRIRCSRQDLAQLPCGQKRFDVVCANLIDDLLLEQRARIIAQVKPQGTLVLAGILSCQFPRVAKAYRAAGLSLVRRQRVSEWESGSFLCPTEACAL